MNEKPRSPTLFDEKDKSLTIRESPLPESVADAETSEPQPELAPPKSYALFSSLGFWLVASLTGLFTLWLTTSLLGGLEALFARNDALGSFALILTIIAGLTLTLLIIREISGLWGLKKLAHLKAEGQRIATDNKLPPARKYIRKLTSIYKDSPDRAWMLARLNAMNSEIMDGRELMQLADREIGAPLDEEAKKLITRTARKVSLITAIAPGPLLDMAAVAVLNLRMIRQIAAIYGVRPGFWGGLNLLRRVITHLALSGGLALTGDLLQPLIGTSIAAKLSKKFGEGLFNGALSIRLGLSAIELTRPIPHLITRPPAFKAIAAASLKPIKQ